MKNRVIFVSLIALLSFLSIQAEWSDFWKSKKTDDIIPLFDRILPEEMKKHKPCRAWNNITSRDSYEKYDHLVDQWATKGLDFRSCFAFLAREEKIEAIDEVKKFISKEKQQDLEQWYQEKQKNNNNVRSTLNIYISPEVSSEQKIMAQNIINNNFCNYDVVFQEGSFPGNTENCASTSKNFTEKEIEISTLYLGHPFNELSCEGMMEMIEHERAHLEEDHFTLGALLKISIDDNPKNEIKKNKALFALDCVWETHADLIPPAMSESVSLTEIFLRARTNDNISIIRSSSKASFKGPDLSDPHPQVTNVLENINKILLVKAAEARRKERLESTGSRFA